MNPHADSLSPQRHPDESQDDYKERRRRLQILSEKAGKWGYVVYDSGAKNARGVRTPVQSKKEK